MCALAGTEQAFNKWQLKETVSLLRTLTQGAYEAGTGHGSQKARVRSKLLFGMLKENQNTHFSYNCQDKSAQWLKMYAVASAPEMPVDHSLEQDAHRCPFLQVDALKGDILKGNLHPWLKWSDWQSSLCSIGISWVWLNALTRGMLLAQHLAGSPQMLTHRLAVTPRAPMEPIRGICIDLAARCVFPIHVLFLKYGLVWPTKYWLY